MKRAHLSTGAAAALLAAAAWLTTAGCLNPRPEELPSQDDGPGFSGSVGDDPDDSATPSGPDNASPSAPTPGAAGAPPAEQEGAPADAGPPDAGLRAPESSNDAEPPSETGEPPE